MADLHMAALPLPLLHEAASCIVLCVQLAATANKECGLLAMDRTAVKTSLMQ